MDGLSLLQGIFPTQGLNPGFPHCRQIKFRRVPGSSPGGSREFEVGTASARIRKQLLAAAKSLQSCPTLCDPIDGSPPGSPVPGILQERTL